MERSNLHQKTLSEDKDANNFPPSTSDSCKNDISLGNLEENLPNVEESSEAGKNLVDSDEEEYRDAKDLCDNESDEELDLDEESIIETHKNLSEEELEKLKNEAKVLKNEGNECFKKADYTEAVKIYTRALNTCPRKYKQDLSILYSNRAAAKMNLEKKEEDAILDCNKALELNPTYLKALVRRAQLFRKTDNLDRSLEDYKQVLELDRNNAEARQACAMMPAEIAERNEKLKNEMFGKLKELGNLCLRPFGLSTDNFKVVQDPNTGSYSVNFQNNGS